MGKLDELKIRVSLKTLVVGIIIVSISLLLGYSNTALGLFYGSILGILNWLLLSKTMQKSVNYSPGKAKAYVAVHYLLRFTILFLALYVAVLREDMNVIAAVVALLIPKGVILWDYVVMGYFNKRKHS